jgi:predicted DNA-binding transcriptional regulator YafY
MTDALVRQWLMLQRIPAHPSRISTKEIHGYLTAEGYDVNVRTVQRDLDQLSSFFPLTCYEEGRAKLWHWAKGAQAFQIPSMTQETALVLKLVEQYLQPLLPGSILQLLQPYMAKASEVLKATRFRGWRKNVRMLVRGPRLIPPSVNDSVREVVYSALLEGTRFNVEYCPRSKGGEWVLREVNPLGLVVKDGITYLVATLWEYDDVLHLALHRMRSAEPLDRARRTVKGFDMSEYIETQANFAYPVSDKLLKLKVRFDSVAAHHLRESRLSQDQEIKDRKDGDVMLTATVPDNSEIRWWLLGFGDQVEVLAPAKLRQEFAQVAANLHSCYTKK